MSIRFPRKKKHYSSKFIKPTFLRKLNHSNIRLHKILSNTQHFSLIKETHFAVLTNLIIENSIRITLPTCCSLSNETQPPIGHSEKSIKLFQLVFLYYNFISCWNQTRWHCSYDTKQRPDWEWRCRRAQCKCGDRRKLRSLLPAG